MKVTKQPHLVRSEYVGAALEPQQSGGVVSRSKLANLDVSLIVKWLTVGVAGALLGAYILSAVSMPAQWVPLLILAVLCPPVALAVGDIRKVLLAVIVLDIPFQVNINFGYRADEAKLGAWGGLEVSLTTISLVILYGLWVSKLLTKTGAQARPWSRAALPGLAFVAATALSIAVARDATLSLYELASLVQLLLLFVYIVGTVRSRQDVLFVTAMLLVSLVLESTFMVAADLLGLNINFAGIKTSAWVSQDAAGELSRAAGTLGSANPAATYLLGVLAPALSVLMTRLGRGYKLLAVAGFALGLVALVMTYSRGGWIGFAVALLVLGFVSWRRGWLPIAIPLIAVVLAVPVALVFGHDIAARLAGNDNGAAYSRVILGRLAFRVIRAKPWLGVGANNFPIVMREYTTPDFAGAWLYAAHDKYLLIWSEAGIGGLLTFIWFLLSSVYWGWKCWMVKDRLLSSLALGFTAAILGIMAQMFFEPFHNRAQLQLLWLYAALLAATLALLQAKGNAEGVTGNPNGHMSTSPRRRRVGVATQISSDRTG